MVSLPLQASDAQENQLPANVQMNLRRRSRKPLLLAGECRKATIIPVIVILIPASTRQIKDPSLKAENMAMCE